jgi:hypothetical protein
MKTNFLEKNGDTVFFQNHSDLIDFFSKIDFIVPKRSGGRKSFHREKSCLKFYLEKLIGNNLINFPLSIIKSESPDFFLIENTIKKALEITDCTTESYQKALTELANNEEYRSIEPLDIYNLENESEGKKLFKEGLRKENDPLVGMPWIGDAVEVEWTKIAYKRIMEKLVKINKPNFQDADICELLIYDNSHVGGSLHVNDGIYQLNKKYQEANINIYARKFDVISLIVGECLVYDLQNSVYY